MLSKSSIDRGRKIIIYSAIAFFICTLSLTLNRHFSFYSSYDQGIFNQIFWNGIHGNFFQSTLSSQLSTNVIHGGEVPYVGYHHLGQHFSLVMLLLPGRHKMLKSRCNQACSPKTSLIISAFLGS